MTFFFFKPHVGRLNLDICLVAAFPNYRQILCWKQMISPRELLLQI